MWVDRSADNDSRLNEMWSNVQNKWLLSDRSTKVDAALTDVKAQMCHLLLRDAPEPKRPALDAIQRERVYHGDYGLSFLDDTPKVSSTEVLKDTGSRGTFVLSSDA